MAISAEEESIINALVNCLTHLKSLNNADLDDAIHLLKNKRYRTKYFSNDFNGNLTRFIYDKVILPLYSQDRSIFSNPVMNQLEEFLQSDKIKPVQTPPSRPKIS